MKIAKNVLALCALLLSGYAAAQTPSLDSLFQQHRWFELRQQLRQESQKGKPVSSLYSGAVASAWDETNDAEKYLRVAIADAPNSPEAAEAHEQLGYIYARSGRYRDVVRELDSILRINPGRADVQNIRSIYAAFVTHRDQAVEGFRHATIQADVSAQGVFLPVSLRGQTVHWLLDTDFNICAMSESEAKLLGVAASEGSAQAGDSSSGTTKARTALVNEMFIGPVRLRNIAFLIVPDSQPPMDRLPPGHRGIIGFPVALALRAIKWTKNGTFEIGFPADQAKVSQSNLFLDGISAVTRVGFAGKELDFILDTGNLAGTQLWQRFADDFPAVLKSRGIQSNLTLTEIGGSTEREATLLPELKLRVGGLETTLSPAAVFGKEVGDGFHHGLLGMDLLNQAREVRIDFRSMRFQLLP